MCCDAGWGRLVTACKVRDGGGWSGDGHARGVAAHQERGCEVVIAWLRVVQGGWGSTHALLDGMDGRAG